MFLVENKFKDRRLLHLPGRIWYIQGEEDWYISLQGNV